MTDQKITNPFEQLDSRLARIERLVEKLFEQPSSITPSSEPSDKEYMTRREVAGLLDVCLTTVDHLSNAGILRKYRSGRIVRFLRSEVMSSVSGNNRFGLLRNPKIPKS